MAKIEEYQAEEILMAYEKDASLAFCRHSGCDRWNEDYNIRTLKGCTPNVCKKWCAFTDELRTNGSRARKRLYRGAGNGGS